VLLALRFFKLVSVVLLFSGSLGAVMASDLADRRRFALRMGVPGLCLSWAFGFALVYQTSASLLTTWVLGALFLSFVSLQGLIFIAARASQSERTGRGAAALVLLPLFSTLALMVWRPD
jgi:hypothetical protein